MDEPGQPSGVRIRRAGRPRHHRGRSARCRVSPDASITAKLTAEPPRLTPDEARAVMAGHLADLAA